MIKPHFLRAAPLAPLATVAVATALATAATAQPAPDAQQIRAQRHQRALNTLRRAMQETTKFKKVHAGEALLWDGYPQGVREAFESEEKVATPDYIHGVWRTLAQTYPKDSAGWRRYENLVFHRFEASHGKDVVGQLETLGKLGFARQTPKIRWIAAHGESRAKAMARWVIYNSGRARDEANLAALLDSSNSEARGLAAYAFRFAPQVLPATARALHLRAQRENPLAQRRVYILSSWFLHAPRTQRAAAKQQLLEYADQGKDAEQYEVGMALALAGDESDLLLLERLLLDEEVDVRISAAHAILSIDRRRARGELAS